MLVHNRYQQPGGEDVVFRQERELLERAGHSVVTYHRSNWELDDSYIGIKQLALAGRTIWSHDTRAEFSEILRTAKPELIHIHNTFVVISPSIYAACQDAGIPVVQTLHNYRLFCPAATFFRNGKVCEECVEHTLWRSVQHACYRDSRSAFKDGDLLRANRRERGMAVGSSNLPQVDDLNPDGENPCLRFPEAITPGDFAAISRSLFE